LHAPFAYVSESEPNCSNLCPDRIAVRAIYI
jgi:hypothetical protein